MRISDWSSDVCSSDLGGRRLPAVTLVPVLMILFVRGRILPERRNPINRALIWLYRPVIRLVLRWKKLTVFLAIIALGASVYPMTRLATGPAACRARVCQDV